MHMGTFKGASLIQAYSRTNRIANIQDKPWGRIVNYRWPAQNEYLMNKALATYANKDSANLSNEEMQRRNVQDEITAPKFEDVLQVVRNKVDKIRNLTDDFVQLPPSEKQKDLMLDLLREYNAGMAKLKQYKPVENSEGNIEGYDYNDPDKLIEALGMNPDEEVMLSTVLTNELKEHIAKHKKIPVAQLELQLTHVKDVKVNYDYLTELIEQLLNQVHEDKTEEAKATQEEIRQFANGLDDRGYAGMIIKAAKAIIEKQFPDEYSNLTYPYKLESSEVVIREANNASLDRLFLDFRIKWGLTEVVTSAQMRELFGRHTFGQQDLNDTGQIQRIITGASDNYQTMASDEAVQVLSKIKYRNSLRDAIYKLADELVIA